MKHVTPSRPSVGTNIEVVRRQHEKMCRVCCRALKPHDVIESIHFIICVFPQTLKAVLHTAGRLLLLCSLYCFADRWHLLTRWFLHRLVCSFALSFSACRSLFLSSAALRSLCRAYRDSARPPLVIGVFWSSPAYILVWDVDVVFISLRHKFVIFVSQFVVTFYHSGSGCFF